MRFVVAPEIFKLYPGLRLPVAVAEDVEAATDTAGVEKLWRQACEEAGQLVPTLRRRPVPPPCRGLARHDGSHGCLWQEVPQLGRVPPQMRLQR